jgi:glucose/arabinose dehydrogenase
VVLNEKQRPISESIWLDKELGRIRDIAVMKDGSILVLNDQADGGLYRITEVKK